MKGSSSCTNQGSATQGSYKAKENNSGLLVGASSLRQRNTVYVPANSNAMLLGNANASTQSGSGLHKNSASMGSNAGHRAQSGNGKHSFANSYVSQQLTAMEASKTQAVHNHSKSNGNMMGSAVVEQPALQTNQYPCHKQSLQQSIQNNNSQQNLSNSHIGQGPGSATSFHANANANAKAKLFKHTAKNAVLANQYNSSANG